MANLERLIARAEAWIADDPDPETCDELRSLTAAAAADEGARGELAARFAGRLEFGTAGIRGILGAGPMRMNRVVVRQVSAGLAAYIADEVAGARERGIVIGYDARKNSRVFAEDAARLFAEAGFKVHFGSRELPTPTTSFAVAELGAAGGVMVTASHNPPDYNGYKVYWHNGAQIIPPHDRLISARIDSATLPKELASFAELSSAGRICPIDEAVIERYLEGVAAMSRRRDVVGANPISIAYTPLHGVGAWFVERALDMSGFDQVHTVASQREPDGAFPTVRFPNPEEEGAMDAVLALADEVGADLVLANDPDVDRLAAALPRDGKYAMLSGDQIGILLADYLLEAEPSGKRMVATTIVSSQLLSEMARANSVEARLTLTGFKWIANAALDFKRDTGGTFVFGYEEALGYSCGELVRDKDGISSIVVFAEMVAYEKSRGRTVWDRLADIYRRHGLYLTEQRSLTLPGADGIERIQSLMARFRATPPAEIGGHKVVESVDVASGAMGLPKSDVLIYFLEGGRRVIMRPSGTEPKLKSYYEVREPVEDGVEEAVSRARAALAALRDAHQATLD